MELSIYEINGRKLSTVMNNNLKEGSSNISVDLRAYHPGLYIIQIMTKTAVHSIKVLKASNL